MLIIIKVDLAKLNVQLAMEICIKFNTAAIIPIWGKNTSFENLKPT